MINFNAQFFSTTGSVKTSSFIHHNSIRLSRLLVGDQILPIDLNSIPAYVGSHDWHKKIIGLCVHSS